MYGIGVGLAEIGFAACVCWQPAIRTEAINRVTRIRNLLPSAAAHNASCEGFRRRKRFPPEKSAGLGAYFAQGCFDVFAAASLSGFCKTNLIAAAPHARLGAEARAAE